jgi:hypothetical protein
LLFDWNYNSLTNKPSLFNGDYNSLNNRPNLYNGAYSGLTGIPTTFTPKPHLHAYSGLTGLPTLFSGNYNDLTNKPLTTITTGTTNNIMIYDNSGNPTDSGLSYNLLLASLIL